MPDSGPGNSSFRLLVLLPNWLGDTVMASGLVSFLDRNRLLPDGRRLHLTLGVRGSWAPLFASDPRQDALLTVERPGRHGGALGAWRLSRLVRAGGFHAAILGPPSLRAAAVAFAGKVPLRVGYRADGRGWLLHPAVNALPRGRVHYAQEQIELGRVLLAELGLAAPSRAGVLDDPLPGCAHIASAAKPGDRDRWILAPGATYGLAKTWPGPRAVEFARLALETRQVELVVLGDAAAGPFAADLALQLGLQARRGLSGLTGLVDLTGKTSLLDVVAILKSAQAFVGNDSGLMHLAGALGVPTLGLFGSSNPSWTAPLGNRARAMAAQGFPCQPCYRKTCNQPVFCLDTLSGREVLEELEGLLTCPAGTEGS